MSSPHTPIWELPDDEEDVEGLDEYGEPDPAYAAALGIVPAPLGRRATAAVLDIGLYCLLQVPYWVFALPLVISVLTGSMSIYGFVNHPNFILAIVMAAITAVLTIAFIAVQTALLGRSGVTFGKGVMGLRAVNVKTLERPGIWRVFSRALVLWGSAVVVIGPLLFFLSPLFDPQKRGRGWHDFVGQTWLVDVRRGLQPYDKKRMRIARKTVTAAPAPQAKSLPSLATAEAAGEQSEYRPAGRISAGVLGVARPHGSSGRTVVGLTGLEESELPPAPGAGSSPGGGPVIGSYLASQHEAQRPDSRLAEQGGPPADASPPPQTPAEAGPDRTSTVPENQYAVRFDTGDRFEVTETLVVGRMPGEVDGARAVPLNDESLSVSKTHMMLRPGQGGVEVTDRGSTNGTAIVRDGAERSLPAGETAIAVPGDTIRFGDRTAVVTYA